MKRSEQARRAYAKKIIVSWAVCFVAGILVGVLLGSLIFGGGGETNTPDPGAAQTETDPSEPSGSTEPTEPLSPEPTDPTAAEVTPPMPLDQMEYLGEWRITGYCACAICCGAWANNRPGGVVYGAAGKELLADHSVASTLPFGTEIFVDGLGEYTVEDRCAQWVADKYGDQVVDIYFDDHEKAGSFGQRSAKVYRIPAAQTAAQN